MELISVNKTVQTSRKKIMLKIVEGVQENQGQFSRYKQGDTKKVEQISKKA